MDFMQQRSCKCFSLFPSLCVCVVVGLHRINLSKLLIIFPYQIYQEKICLPVNSPLQPRSSGAVMVTPGWPLAAPSQEAAGASWHLPAEIDQGRDLRKTAKVPYWHQTSSVGIQIYFTFLDSFYFYFCLFFFNCYQIDLQMQKLTKHIYKKKKKFLKIYF